MMMLPSDYSAFQKTLAQKAPSRSWPLALKSLWHDAKGDWDTAHNLVDHLSDPVEKWIHAYLHRKEGDDWNAGYWYRQAGKPFPKITLEQEFQVLLSEILKRNG